MNLKLLSRYRAQIMGVAIILVALFHSSIIHFTDGVDMACFCGDMGVDIFLFISGFGMYYSLLKQKSIKKFYFNRFSRIVPTWVIINLFVQLYGSNLSKIEIIPFLKNMTGFNFWIDGSLFYWYIPAILMFYLWIPLFYHFYKKNRLVAFAGIACIWIILVFLSLLVHDARYFIFIFRIPIFFIGIFVGEISYNEKKISTLQLVTCGVVVFVGGILLYFIKVYNGTHGIRYDYKYLVFAIVTVPLCVILSFLFECIKCNFVILKFLGGITLEIYLLHEYILRQITGVVGDEMFDHNKIIFNVLVFIGVVGIAKIIHELINYAMKYVIAKK